MYDFNNIPQELKDLKQWLLWRLVDKNDGKKPTKIPYQVNGKLAKTTDSTTWSSFNEVVETYKRLNKYYSGIGFVFTAEDPYVGIDLDHVIDANNNIDEESANILKELSSYTEISQSGTGTHTFVKAKIPGALKTAKIEMYEAGRYFTVTGNLLQGSVNTIEERQDAINNLYEKYKKVPKNRQKSTTQLASTLSDTSIFNLARSAKNGGKFLSLNNGFWEAEGYPSQSEADQAFCNILAYYTQDPSQINRIFKKSGLYREKWDRPDYKSKTIETAINNLSDTYGNQKEKPRERGLIEKNQTITDTHCNTNNANLEEIQAPILPGIFEHNNCYCKWITKGKGDSMERVLIEVTNFIIEPLDKIESELANKLRVNIKRKDGCTFERTFNIKTDLMGGYSAFKKALDELLIFDGADRELEAIKRIILTKPFTTKKGLTCSGFHKVDDKWIFTTGSGTVDQDLKPVENIILLKNPETLDSNILEKDPIKADELKIIADKLFNFNDLGKAATIMGCMASVFFKEKMLAEKIKFNHLFVIGESGSGKSSTIEDIVIPIMNMESNIKGADKITKFALEKIASSTNFLPLIIDEYKPFKMRDFQVDMISDAIRNIYGNIGVDKGNKDQTVSRYVLKSPVLLIGEDNIKDNETAALERALKVNFSKLESKKEERTAAYKFLKDNSKLLNKLGRSLLNESLELPSEDIKTGHKFYIDNTIPKDINADRIINSIANCMLGIGLIKGVFDELNVDFKLTGYTYEEVLESINNTVYFDLLDESTESKSVIDNIIESFDTFADAGSLINEFHYKIVGKKLMLNLKRIFHTIEVEKHQRFELAQGEFSRQLKKQYYFDDNQISVRMKKLKDDSLMAPCTCTQLDIYKMLEKKIEIPTFLGDYDPAKTIINFKR